MFNSCSSLKELNLPNINTNKLTSCCNVFTGCSKELIMKIKSLNKFKEDAF